VKRARWARCHDAFQSFVQIDGRGGIRLRVTSDRSEDELVARGSRLAVSRLPVESGGQANAGIGV
jgi:hypothetical protein